jgi:hypothetical protein
MRWVDNNICVQENDGENYPLGWYFRTEDEALEGPFGTIEETRENLAKYVIWLNGGEK